MNCSKCKIQLNAASVNLKARKNGSLQGAAFFMEKIPAQERKNVSISDEKFFQSVDDVMKACYNFYDSKSNDEKILFIKLQIKGGGTEKRKKSRNSSDERGFHLRSRKDAISF